MPGKTFEKIIHGYKAFREKYVQGKEGLLPTLSKQGQSPAFLVVACCDSRVDPALLLQCDPGDLFVVRNVANIIPPFENDGLHHGCSAALEYGVCYLNVRHIIILGHSQCGGIQAFMEQDTLPENDFLSAWVGQLRFDPAGKNVDECSKHSVDQSYQHALTFPWVQSRVEAGTLQVHRWFFDIKTGEIYAKAGEDVSYKPLSSLFTHA